MRIKLWGEKMGKGKKLKDQGRYWEPQNQGMLTWEVSQERVSLGMMGDGWESSEFLQT